MSWIIYKHTNKIDGKVYIGQTHYSNPKERFKNGLGYKRSDGKRSVFWDAIQKYGWNAFKTTYLAKGIQTKEEANRLEIFYINKYKSCIYFKDCNGYNMTIGGDDRTYFGKIVYQIEKQTLKKIAQFDSVKGAQNETGISGISDVVYGDSISAGGYYWVLKENYYPGWKPRENKNKLRERPILCIEKNVIYENTSIAAKSFNVSKTLLCTVLKRKRPTALGYHWCYADEYNDEYILRTDERGWNRRKITRIDDGKEFNSISEAALEVGVDVCTIQDCLSMRTNTAGGFEWCYSEDFKTYQHRQNKHYRKVRCINTGKVYEKIRDAAYDTGANESKINDVCKGRRKTAAGLMWEYVDE